ncbi:uncharacterized protein LOC100116348 isoform X4 [Nasonia vitripennis]|uniref:Uncharacterized protein n=1 Tax=Nasonia vitripennis TaxID=7425 RepID=A0A7M7QZS2_NASVI|nr:uncharacterized protein LOC100116348 isoform X4 [Nasonia vitripennis]XP_032457029.1 uncharacterized protein LOC100116348 isoform X4 [Nasonia vitripennis]
MDKVNGLIMSGMESAAQMFIGQAFLRLIDRILWIVEKSVQWSLPSEEVSAKENGKTFGKADLVRPLPWIIFLPALLFLRIIRIGLDALGAILGYPQVEPSDMVRVIQRGRRRIRAIKSSGLKSMRLRSTPVIKVPPMSEETSGIDSAVGSPNQDYSKRKYSEIGTDESSLDESDEETLISKINRLANASDSDKDFSISDCPSVGRSETSASESEADVSIPLSEVEDLKAEKEEMEKQWCDNPQCTKTTGDNELHKLTECLVKLEKLNAQPRINGSKDQEEPETTAVVAEKDMPETLATNGVGHDRDTAYYSPISWKSVSPEVSIPSDKQDNHIDVGEKPMDELNNGQLYGGEEINEDCDIGSKNSCASGVSGQQTGESIKEKQRSSSQSSGGGASKHHQKHKRGNYVDS